MLDFEDLVTEELGFFEVVTPGQISDFRRSLITSATSLDKDYEANKSKIGPLIFDAWKAWYNDLLVYNEKSGWFGDLWGGAMNTAERKAAELADWRSIYQDSTGATSSIPDIQKTHTTNPVDLSIVKWVAVPIIAYFVWDLIKKR